MASTKRKVRCHYEVLEVEHDADDAALKKAYRRKALKYHPDKNPDNIEESTRLFRDVQQAYDVLTDPQERAWYDKHRDVILAGGGDEYEDDALDLGQYFTASAYSGFNDGERGFYTVYGEVFATVMKEEAPFDSESEESDGEIEADEESGYAVGKVPQFGRSDAPYEACVGPFYAYWSNFSTKKSFVWVEKYDTRQGPDRRTRRLMEADNKKSRDEARKRRTDSVRTLVDWLKRRDPRVKARAQHNRELEAERERREKERRRERTLQRNQELESFEEAEWSSMATLQKELASVEKGMLEEFGDSDDGDDIAAAAMAMAAAGQDANGDGGGAAINSDDVYEYVQDALYCVACDKSFASEKTMENHQRSRRHKDNVVQLRRELQQDDVDDDGADTSIADVLAQLERDEADVSISSQGGGGGKKSKKAKKKKRQAAAAAAALEESDSDDALAAAIRGDATASGTQEAGNADADADASVAVDEADGAEGAAAESSSGKKSSKSGKKQSSAATPSRANTELDLLCVVCGETFPSRNKMFQHLKDTDHAQPLGDRSAPTSSGKKSKKGKKRKS